MPKAIKFYSVAEASRLTGLSDIKIQSLFKRRKFRSAIMYWGEIRIPLVDLQPYIQVTKVPELRRLPIARRQGAIMRLAVLGKYERLLNEYGAKHRSKSKAEKQACRVCKVSIRTIYRWKSWLFRYGIRGLVDSRGGSKR